MTSARATWLELPVARQASAPSRAATAAETAAACLEAGDLSDGALAAYETRWQADFGRELALGYRLQLARRKVAPAEIDRLLRAFGNPKVVRTIVEKDRRDDD